MIMKQAGRQTILLIEDSDEDFVATERAVIKTGYDLQLKRAENAEKALDFLLGRTKNYDDKSKNAAPALILLDLNLPGLDGRDLLMQLKRDERLKEIPVVILTTSENPQDVLHCYRNGANGYQLKVIGFDKFYNSIKEMILYWFGTATLPSAVN